MSVKGTSIQLNMGFRKHWLIQKGGEGGQGVVARFHLTSDSPKFMHITLQVSLQVKARPVSVYRLLRFIRTNVRAKKVLLNVFVLPRTEWVKSRVVVGAEEQSVSTCTSCRLPQADDDE